jgi:8-oxo-dGTP diphosphatase
MGKSWRTAAEMSATSPSLDTDSMAKRDGGQTRIVQAAGGVVTRAGSGGEVEVLVVHRPRYDDWTLPKGKLASGEAHPDAALREVEEETGVRCSLERELAGAAYIDSRGRPKEVRYWHMQPLGGSFTPSDEVDEIRWVALGSISELLSYERDIAVVASLFTTVSPPVLSGTTHGTPAGS